MNSNPIRLRTWFVDRRKPYTKIGIRRVVCVRCGGPPAYQWQICSDRNRYRPVCRSCDVALNALVLKFMNHPEALRLSTEYAKEKV